MKKLNVDLFNYAIFTEPRSEKLKKRKNKKVFHRQLHHFDTNLLGQQRYSKLFLFFVQNFNP
ncbi:hypothetical protein DR864_20955 [Runella rosea]|uniref:Uncharacterized protein n=1 Tax=Runella rosea TaxID=2259595 RepID=A0A344TN20_9BACT|nr:hypothetical protein DR864_20955 [Runella rosea]